MALGTRDCGEVCVNEGGASLTIEVIAPDRDPRVTPAKSPSEVSIAHIRLEKDGGPLVGSDGYNEVVRGGR